MAVYFNLSANFGALEKEAQKFIDYFSKKKIILSDKNIIPLECYYSKVEDNQLPLSTLKK